MLFLGSIGCWTRLNSDTGGLEPLGASQDLKLEQIVYQEAGEYKCVTPAAEATKKLNSLRHSYSVDVIVKGISFSVSSCVRSLLFYSYFFSPAGSALLIKCNGNAEKCIVYPTYIFLRAPSFMLMFYSFYLTNYEFRSPVLSSIILNPLNDVNGIMQYKIIEIVVS